MTFLNALLALGSLAFSIPLIIHLLNRSRYITIDWGAMQFLESSVRVNARRIQWKQLLLLLIRCLIPVLLALAMARPIVLSWRDSGASNAMALAVLLDDSLSMQTLDDSSPNASTSRWTRACRELSDIADQLPTGSSICLILTGSPPEVYRDLDAQTLKEKMEAWSNKTAFSGNFDLQAGIEKGLEWLQQASLAKRHLMVVSDFTSSDWRMDQDSRIQDSQQLLAQQSIPIPWSFLNVSESLPKNNAYSDIAIKTMEIAPRVASVGAPLSVTASVQNDSDTKLQIPIRLFADNEEIEMQSVTVPPRATTTARFRWAPKEKGDVELKFQAENEDLSPEDNRLMRVMRVMAPLRVLLIDGARRGEAMKSESDFLRYALTPFSLLQGLPGDVFSTRVVDPNGWDERVLKEHDLAVCCNVPDLSPQHRKWLRSFVERGGGVLFAMGDGVLIDRYNTWEMIADGGLRPGKLVARAEWQGGVKQTETPLFELTPQVVESLGSIQVRHRHAIEDADNSGWCGFAYEDSAPWIASYTIRNGRCVWMYSSCDDGDSNFPARPAYLPILQKLMLFAAQTPNGWRSIEPGDRWVESWTNVPLESSDSIEWWHDGGEPSSASLTQAGEGRDGKIDRVSEIDAPRSIGVVQARVGSNVRKIMVDASPSDRNRELMRDLLPDDGFINLAQRVGAKHSGSSEEWMSQVRSRWSGRELWFWCWLALIGLVLAEMALQQSFLPTRAASLPRSTQAGYPNSESRGAA